MKPQDDLLHAGAVGDLTGRGPTGRGRRAGASLLEASVPVIPVAPCLLPGEADRLDRLESRTGKVRAPRRAARAEGGAGGRRGRAWPS
jgi:hypothetical protein